MDAAQYRCAVAQCFRDAAVQGIIERYYRVGRGAHRVMQDAGQMSVACYLVDAMVSSPFWTHEPRLFMAVEPLMPELGHCITELRRLILVEDYVKRGELILADLQARVSKVEETAELSDSARQLRLPISQGMYAKVIELTVYEALCQDASCDRCGRLATVCVRRPWICDLCSLKQLIEALEVEGTKIAA